MCPFFRKLDNQSFQLFPPFFTYTIRPLSTLFSYFRRRFPDFVERFLYLHDICFYPTTKKLLPDKVLFISEPARKKPSLLLFILFPASIPVRPMVLQPLSPIITLLYHIYHHICIVELCYTICQDLNRKNFILYYI